MSITTNLIICANLLTVSPDVYHDLKEDLGQASPLQIFALQATYLASYAIDHTNLDETLLHTFHQNIPFDRASFFADLTKRLSEMNLFLLYSTLYTTTRLFDSPVTKALESLMKSYIIGASICLISQRLIGLGRPDQGDSNWALFQTATGASGHAFSDGRSQKLQQILSLLD